ncbi:DUF1345 domain-containing protein [Phenylobacterium sp.]|uniref:DUF1345 domain-containing protein n=1 Tax=Phenylobacterium sp. TaxID=1871053 RepID=UPI0039833166
MAKPPAAASGLQIIGAFVARPRLLAAMAVGLMVGVGCAVAGAGSGLSTMLGWDAAWATFVLATLPAMFGQTPDGIRRHAARTDEGRAVVLVMVLAAAMASVGTVGLELPAATSREGPAGALRVALALVTVAGSWFLVQFTFALHYAHAYYGHGAGGLKFPGRSDPDYWDFLHFSLIIGVAAQTADIAITSQALRRLCTVHSVIAFVFNTVIVALAINLSAGLVK